MSRGLCGQLVQLGEPNKPRRRLWSLRESKGPETQEPRVAQGSQEAKMFEATHHIDRGPTTQVVSWKGLNKPRIPGAPCVPQAIRKERVIVLNCHNKALIESK